MPFLSKKLRKSNLLILLFDFIVNNNKIQFYINEVLFVLVSWTVVFQIFQAVWRAFCKHLRLLHVKVWEALIQSLLHQILWLDLFCFEQFCLFPQLLVLLFLGQFFPLDLQCLLQRKRNHIYSRGRPFGVFFFSQNDFHICSQFCSMPFTFFVFFFLPYLDFKFSGSATRNPRGVLFFILKFAL